MFQSHTVALCVTITGLLLGLVHTENKAIQSNEVNTAHPGSVIDRPSNPSDNHKSSTTIYNNENIVDSFTAANSNNNNDNKSPITTATITATVYNKSLHGSEGIMTGEGISSLTIDSNGNPRDNVVKNATNVPTKDDLAAMEAKVDMVQHKIDIAIPTDTPNEKPNNSIIENVLPNTAIKNRDNVPTRDELIALGSENVDKVQHRIELPRDQPSEKSGNVKNDIGPSRTDVKNRENVPTRDELIAAGVENVDMVQHRVEFPIDNPIDKASTSTINNDSSPPKTGIKNRDNVPTRNEFIAAGADNADMVQHRIESHMDAPIEESSNVNNENNLPNTAIKNSENVRTRNELAAAGIDNVDMIQHRVEFPIDIPTDKSSKINNESGPPKTGIKNRDNVPTREELIAAGADNVDIVQHRIEFPIDQPNNKASTNVTNKDNGPPKTGIKNRDNVPTRNELVTAGVDNVDMVQHRVESPIDNPIDKASTSTINNDSSPPETGIKNRDNVPTRDELIAAGVDNADMVQHRVEDTIDLNWLVKNKKTSGTITNGVVDDFQPKRIVNNPMRLGESVNELVKNVTDTNNNTSQPKPTTTITTDTTETVQTTTTENVSKTNQQIPEPKRATETTVTSSNQQTTPGQSEPVKPSGVDTASGNKGTTIQTTGIPPRNAEVSTLRTTGMPPKMANTTDCPMLTCAVTCNFGYKNDDNGCRTCDCEYSNNCPKAIPISRLLCLLQARRTAECASDDDCALNRNCCPGTCGTICRRKSRNRSMLLSMLLD